MTTTTNKPRESVLSLFDPLATPSTPERETSSPDSGSSDKENDGPGQVTVFFNRIYSRSKQPVVETPKGKLIDFGDVTLHDEFDFHDEDEEIDEDSENVGEVLSMIWIGNDRAERGREMSVEEDENRQAPTSPVQSPQATRRPLADIQLEFAVAPLPSSPSIKEEPSASSPASSSWSDEITPTLATSHAPAGAPLANVINSINITSLTLSDTQESEAAEYDVAGRTEEPVESAPSLCPEITVCPPQLDTTSSILEANSGRLPPTSRFSVADSSLALPTVTRRPQVSTSAADPRRISVDLQSSFCLQMQSPEMSFDLINDKISFLGQDSFWAGGDDDTIDFKKEEQTMMAIAEEYEQLTKQSIPTAPPRKSLSPKTRDTKVASPVSRPPVFSLPAETELQRDKEDEPIEIESTSIATRSNVLQAEKERNLPISQAMSQVPESPAQTEPVPPTIPAVPALRIVKKTFKIHDRTASVSSVSSTASTRTVSSTSSASSSRSASLSDSDFKEPSVLTSRVSGETSRSTGIAINARETEPERARTIVRGLQRPPPGAQLPPMKPTGPARMRVPNTIAASSTAANAETRTKLGLTRPTSIASRIGGITRPVSRVPNTTAAGNSGASRVQRPPSVIGGVQGQGKIVGTTASSGIRPPRYASAISSIGTGAGTGTSARSNLPVPPSRLPSVSGASVRGTSASLKMGGARLASGSGLGRKN